MTTTLARPYPKAPDYDPANLHSEGTLRGKALSDLLQRNGVSLTRGNLLDLGCGFGGISIYAARQGATVTAVDAIEHKVNVVNARIADEQWPAGAGVTVLRANATGLPLETESFDTAITLGVIEWVPLTVDGEPRMVQLQALREIARVLKPGGAYVFGTKNRWFPNYALREPQNRRPLLNHLPRSAAQWLSQHLYGEPYRTYTHSLAGWRAMLLESGFDAVDALLPLYFYQFPLGLISHPSTAELSDALNSRAAWLTPEYRYEAEKGATAAKKAFSSIVMRSGLAWFLWPAFIFVARKRG